jgi:hypothetical protein
MPKIERIEEKLNEEKARAATDLITLVQQGDAAAFHQLLQTFPGQTSFWITNTGIDGEPAGASVSRWKIKPPEESPS